MTPDEQREIASLRRHYGISASQYMREVPHWEVEMLLAALEEE